VGVLVKRRLYSKATRKSLYNTAANSVWWALQNGQLTSKPYFND